MDDDARWPLTEIEADLERRRRGEMARLAARSPTKINKIMADVVRKRGYARVVSQRQIRDAWNQVVREVLGGKVGESETGIGMIRRGVLEVRVSHSILNQELTFRKATIVARLRELAPDQAIRDIRIRVGKVSS